MLFDPLSQNMCCVLFGIPTVYNSGIRRTHKMGQRNNQTDPRREESSWKHNRLVGRLLTKNYTEYQLKRTITGQMVTGQMIVLSGSKALSNF